ncbi:MAG: hypothetical protein QOD75_2747 [Blastocatellia bacterium]|jgi:hypothetical protein|nr:hypothetical protein [Blastocatellia bacterium]
MSVNESSATALVRFTGLGIICFSQERQRGEIAVIRDHKHTLTVKIQKPAYQEGGGIDIIAYQDIASYQKLPKEDVQIEIKVAGKPVIQTYELYQPGDFDRLDCADVNDFRWIVNMSTLHGGTPLAPTRKRDHPVSKIAISNGLFYTYKLDTNLFFEMVEKDPSGHPAQREVFGNVGETIGVKLEGDEVNFTIRVGGREETHTLRRVEGLPFKIEIKNMDYSDNAVYSDMADYYGFVASQSGKQFDFTPILEEGEGSKAEGGAVNQLEFCHPVVVDDPPGIG